ncbi:MAG: DUF7768 domain-containing protein [Alphaproteobacteria bacterium]
MKRIYVAGRYSADNIIDCLKNIGKGKKACAELFHDGFFPFCPWHDASYVEDACYANEIDKIMFYKASLAWLEVSDAVYVISGQGDGGGVDAEIEYARSLGIPVFNDHLKLTTWAGN